MTPSHAITQPARPSNIGLALAPDADRSAAIARRLEVRPFARLRAAVDFVVLVLAAGCALIGESALQRNTADVICACAFPVLAMAVLHRYRPREETLASSTTQLVSNALIAIGRSALLALGVATILGLAHPVALGLRLGVFSALLLVIARACLATARTAALRNASLATPTLVVGAGKVGGHLVRRLAENPHYGLRPVGFVDSDPLGVALPGDDTVVPVLGDLDGLSLAVAQTGARRVILAFSGDADEALVDSVGGLQAQGVVVSVVPRLYQHFTESSTIDHVGGLPVVSLRPTDPFSWGFAIKHGIDRSLAGLMLIVLAPTLAAIALAVKLTSPGPVLFRQRRVGRDGVEFDVLKFRSMRMPTDTDASFQVSRGSAPGGVEGTDRRTPIGKFIRASSLDELPQLFNVLRGDMSIVGPRPERPEFVAHYSEEIESYTERHRVKSGITGLAQANGLRGQTSILDRVELDNYYIRNWSLFLDLRIVVMTVREVIRMRAA